MLILKKILWLNSLEMKLNRSSWNLEKIGHRLNVSCSLFFSLKCKIDTLDFITYVSNFIIKKSHQKNNNWIVVMICIHIYKYIYANKDKKEMRDKSPSTIDIKKWKRSNNSVSYVGNTKEARNYCSHILKTV